MSGNYELFSDTAFSINRSLIDPDAVKIIGRLQSAGFAGFLVGGSIRDLLLHKAPKDFDIATDATPGQMKRLFRNCRIIGQRFKLAHVFFPGNKIIEVATFRGPLEENAGEMLANDNNYGTMETDALRRDLTVNALFYDPLQGIIIDYVGGVEDIRRTTIRIIGDADKRFHEDPVRMVRAIRQQARTGFRLDKACQESIDRNHELLLQCPAARIYDEFKKDLLSGYLQEILTLLQERGILKLLLPNLSWELQKASKHRDLMFCLKGLDRLSLERKLDSPVPALTILALFSLPDFELGRNIAEIYEKQTLILDRLPSAFEKLPVSKKEKHIIRAIVRAYWVSEHSQIRKRNFKLKNFEYLHEFKTLLMLLNINQTLDHLKKVIRF